MDLSRLLSHELDIYASLWLDMKEFYSLPDQTSHELLNFCGNCKARLVPLDSYRGGTLWGGTLSTTMDA